MQFMPQLKLGILNGWIPIVVFYVVYVATLLALPRDKARALFARSEWSRRQVILLMVGKLFALAVLASVILTPLQPLTVLSGLGWALYLLGMVGFSVALLHFCGAAEGKPATSGLYAVSRNPQQVSLAIVFLGLCLIIGSGVALAALVIGQAFAYSGIRAQEEACLRQFGESYRAYMQRVPRYLLWF